MNSDNEKTLQSINEWYARNAPQAVLAEIVEAREYGEHSGVSKCQAVARLVDCEHRVRQLLSPFSERPDLEQLVADLRLETEHLKARIVLLESSDSPPNRSSKRKQSADVCEQYTNQTLENHHV